MARTVFRQRRIATEKPTCRSYVFRSLSDPIHHLEPVSAKACLGESGPKPASRHDSRVDAAPNNTLFDARLN